MEIVNMSIGEVLKKRRIELAIKQEDMAEQVGVTVQTVSKWERGITEPKASQVNQLAKILKLSEREICQGNIESSSDMDTLEFVRRVGILMQEVPHTEMLFGMHEYIPDREGFLKMLSKVSNHPYELFAIRDANAAKDMLELAENGSIKFENDKQKQDFIENQKQIIAKVEKQ